MRTTAIALFTVATVMLGGCEGSEVRRPLSADGFVPDSDDADDVDDSVDGDVDEDADAGDDAADGSETETDVGPREPSVEFWFVARTGALNGTEPRAGQVS